MSTTVQVADEVEEVKNSAQIDEVKKEGGDAGKKVHASKV